MANSDEKRITLIESKMTSIEKQLSDISSILKDKMKSEAKTRKQNILPDGNIWANKERLEVVMVLADPEWARGIGMNKL